MHRSKLVLTLIGVSTLAACGGGGGGGTPTPPTPPTPPAPTPTFAIGGTVTGLTGSGLILQGPSGTLAVNANGTFSFPTPAPQGATYDVRVSVQPSSPAQTCAVANGTGTIAAAVTNIAVTCANGALIGGVVSGLAANATGLVLTNNGGDHLTINTNGAFAFAGLVPTGSAYDIRVLSHPYDPYQNCRVDYGGSGTVSNTGASGAMILCSTLVPKFATSLDFNNESYSQYAIDATTGQLRSRGYAKVGANPVDVGASDMSGSMSFVLSRGTGSLHAFSRNPLTGRVTESQNSPLPTGAVVFNQFGANALTVHPRLNVVYVANGATANSIGAIAFDASSGALSLVAGSPFSAGSSPVKVAIDPTGRFAYAANRDSNDLSAYSINQTTGALTSLGATVPTGTAIPSYPVVHPSGKFLYVPNLDVAGGTISAFTIGANGALTAIANSPYAVAPNLTAPIVFHPSGRFLYVKTRPLGLVDGAVFGYQIDQTTGALTAIGTPTTVGTGPNSLWMDQSGRFIIVANRGNTTGSISVLRVNATTGELTTVASPDIASISPAPYSASLDWSGKFLYVPSDFGNVHRTYAFDVASGIATSLTSSSGQVVSRGSPVTLIGVPSSDAAPANFRSKFAYVPSNTHITAYSTNATSGAHTRQVSAGDNGPLAAPALGAVVHPSNDVLLALLNQQSNFAVSYSMNNTTGELGGSKDATGTGVAPNAIVVDPTGRFAYVADGGANTIRQYSWDLATGSIGAPLSTGMTTGQPTALAMHPNGRHLYYISNDRWGMREIDPTNGSFVGGGDSTAGIGGHSAIIVHPSGRFAYITRFGSPGAIDVYAIAPRTTGPTVAGQLVPQTSVAVGNQPLSITIDGTGVFLYVSDQTGQHELRALRIAFDGSLVSTGTSNLQFNSPVIVRADYGGKFLHVVETTAAQLRSYEIDRSTGGLTPTSAAPVATGSGPKALALSEDVE